ncbi:ATP-binding protein [Ectobacillus panaciterrae]|uniref:ATP-binding protein n=1 Tax=Ectobacillus panaciterrae TaxID=363872 RepID=UPI00040E12E6|nr:ATP-binding protein [Ectobacillus panaciterrae]
MLGKLIPKLEYPVLQKVDHILYTKDGDAWVYFPVNPQVLKLNDVYAENKFIEKLSNFGDQIKLPTHYIVVPKSLDVKKRNEMLKKQFDGAFVDIGVKYIDRATEILEYELQGAVEYLFFIGVQLPKPKGATEFIKNTKKAFSRFTSSLGKIVTLQDGKIDDDIKSHYEKEAEEVFAAVKSKMSCRKATTEELEYLEQQAFVRGQKQEVTSEAFESIINVKRAGYVKLTQLEEESWCSFLPVTTLPINMTYSRWMFVLQQLPFPVEIHVRTEYRSADEDRSEVVRAKRKFKDQDAQIAEINEDEDTLVNQGRVLLADLENKIKNEGRSLVRTNIVLVVSDQTKEGLDEKIRDLKQTCKNMHIKIIQPIADQLHLFHQSLIGSRILVRDWEQPLLSEALAESLFGLSQKVGNNIGFYLGKNISDGSSVKTSLKPVFFHPQLGNQRIAGAKTRSLHFMVLGPTGMGKSFLVKNLWFYATFLGTMILKIDPKNETETKLKEALAHFSKEDYPEFHEMVNHINFISLSHEEKDKGKLDPLRFLEGVEAEDTAVNLLESLAKVQDTERQISNAITEAVQQVIRDSNPGLYKVVEVLKKSKHESVRDVGVQLDGYSKSSLGKLLFSDGFSESISLDKQVNIIQIQNLDLPKAEMDKKTYNRSQHLSVCTMIPLAKFTTKFLRNEIEGTLKLAIFEEAWALENTTQGTALIKEMLRTGRSLNCGCGIVTQSAKDYNEQDVKEQVGVRFAFRAEDEREQEDILKFFDLPVNAENRSLLAGLEEGECLFRDIYGRTAKIGIDVLFDEWVKAFNTVSKTKAVEVSI